MERFDAPWERTLWFTTGLFVILGPVMAVVLLGLDLQSALGPRGPTWALWVVPLGLAVATGLGWAFSPRGFAFDRAHLTVIRPLSPVRIPLASIRAMALIDRKQAGTLVRVAGSGGLFGYYGRYWSRALGAFRLYATRRDQWVVVDTDGGRFVLTPATPERFLAVLGRAAPQAGPALPARPGGLGGGTWKLLVAAAVGVPLLIGAILLAAAAYAPVAAVVEADAIRIERRWAGPDRLPLSGVRSVTPLAPEAARGWWRVNGVGGLGSSSYGAYRSEVLGPFTLYAWRRGPYLLLETGAGRVVLSADDPTAFVAEVEARRR
jgi:hypothetical protein